MNIARLAQRDLILFDLDGTLVDSAFDLYRAMNISLGVLELPSVSELQVRTWIGKGTSLFCESVLKHVTGVVDPAQHQLLLNTFLEIYNADPCVDTQPFNGILPFLAWAKQHQKTLICVTNKPEIPARKILDELDMSHYFADVVGGDRFEVRKPDPKPLLHCVEAFNSSIEKTLMIGDSSNDVEAARRAGIDCIVVSYGYNHGEDIRLCQPQQIVDNLEELLN
ncbi:MAG: HAD-IA family hydrolase [Candidatus Acinetobacter avistercoris]|nr:HAD-IA family hydrolase [Candidatus Acinetobacter avistercoris]